MHIVQRYNHYRTAIRPLTYGIPAQAKGIAETTIPKMGYLTFC